jgi:hypothetical protein
MEISRPIDQVLYKINIVSIPSSASIIFNFILSSAAHFLSILIAERLVKFSSSVTIIFSP